MDQAIERFLARGHQPLYLWGGGHSVQGTQAMVEAAEEFRGQTGDWIPDVVVVASGTGTTQAGLVAGFDPTKTRLIGVSVARPTETGGAAVKQSLDQYCQLVGCPTPSIIEFRDEWTCGGYGQYGDRLLAVIRRAAGAGLVLDPTYSGKSFLGLIDLVRSGEISKGMKVLYWHTGGLMNLVGAHARLGASR
jgi:D-cysteine desulfhydrase